VIEGVGLSFALPKAVYVGVDFAVSLVIKTSLAFSLPRYRVPLCEYYGGRRFKSHARRPRRYTGLRRCLQGIRILYEKELPISTAETTEILNIQAIIDYAQCSVSAKGPPC
jgi:hypothetical protein